MKDYHKDIRQPVKFSRREMLRASMLLGGAALIGPKFFGAKNAGAELLEIYPTSPFILEPFTEALPIPRALAPSDPTQWRDPVSGFLTPPGPGIGQQDSNGGTHQIWSGSLGLPNPVCYHLKLQVNEHRFTNSPVLPINSLGQTVVPPDGIAGPRLLPASTIYGFNGTFPGPMINAQYGKPVLIRFENELHLNPLNLDRQDFGAPDWTFLTHLHNGHTAPESDGNPHYAPHGYFPQQWVDNLYLMYPPDNDPREKQSFLWFHDHRMDHTGANVYKGMVGLMPHYDPVLDPGDETKGLRLPGVRRNNPNGTFDVEYDIPLAFYDLSLDDGVIPHFDLHSIGQPTSHPEWWGKSFFKHYPNHGFVGDIFTVNGKAYPVLNVKRRKYRFRMLDASIARIYDFQLMQGTPVPSPGTMGQWLMPNGQQCMRFTQIATDGGLLPTPIVRDSIELWPAKRREVIVDFTKYMDGTPTQPGDVVYLVNRLPMSEGRKPDKDRDKLDEDYQVPVLKFVIGGIAKDVSLIPTKMRALPPRPTTQQLSGLRHRTFVLDRSGTFGEERQWLINGLPFDELHSLADPVKGSAEVWTFENGSGGWVHPLHPHMEEHQVVERIDRDFPDPVDDRSREDVVALDPGETVSIYRKFRTFTGNYVAHCHNLAHEDHAMMFGWKIVP